MRHQITVPHIWSNMGKYKVVETFVSINGEATHAESLHALSGLPDVILLVDTVIRNGRMNRRCHTRV